MANIRNIWLICFVIQYIGPSFCEYSNIDTIRDLNEHHDLGVKTSDEEYNFCIRDLLHKADNDSQDVFGPFFTSFMEMTDVNLPCSPCTYGSRPVPQWTKLTFENHQMNISSEDRYIIQPDDRLTIKSARFEDFGTYYCTVEGKVGYIWSLEIEAYEDLEVIKANRWSDVVHPFDEMTISTHWKSWSDCNKCDKIGKRHRFGYCFVRGDPTIVKHEYEALSVYRNGLSCNLFLLLHPYVEEESIPLLANSPLIMIGFCKVSCDNFPADPADVFLHLNPKIHEIYLEQKHHQSRDFYRDKTRRIRGLIPGKPTTFEATIVILFLIFEMYIILRVCKNTGKAK